MKPLKILWWMFGQIPQHSIILGLKSPKSILQNARRITIDFECSNLINEALDANPSYLGLHHKTLQSNWHQYIEYLSMWFEMLNNNLSLMRIRWSYFGSTQLKKYNSINVYKAIYNTCDLYKACKTAKQLSSLKKMHYQTLFYLYMKVI